MSGSRDTVDFELIDLSSDEDSTDSNGDQHNKEFLLNQLEAACSKRLCLDGIFFTVNKDRSSLNGPIYARCNFCKPDKYIKVSLVTQSNAIQHLKNVHPGEHKRYQKYAQSKRKTSKRRSRTSLQESFKQNVMNYILKSMVPFNTVEKKSFRKIFDDLNIQNLEHMTQDSLSRMITQRFKKDIEDIRETVAKIECVCATVDAWSGNNGRFIGVTLYWIDEKTYKRKSAAIACKRFPGPRSNEASAIHTSYNLIPEKMDATLTDNESNFIKDFKEHGVIALERLFSAVKVEDDGSAKTHIVQDLSSDDTASEDANFFKQCQRLPRHLRCASDTLRDLANTDIIKVIEQSGDLKNRHSRVLAKCESLWETLRSPTMNESLGNYLGTALLQPVLTRWKSLFDALQQLVILKEKLLTCNSENAHGITLQDAFTKSDFEYLGEYITSTKPLAKAIDQLEIETYCYYGYLLPILVTLRRNLRRLLGDDAGIKVCKPLVVGMIEALETRFKNMFEASDEGISAAIAAVSHPVFKGDWLRCLSFGIQKIMHNHVVNAVAARFRSNMLLDQKGDDSGDDFDFGDEPPTDQDPVVRTLAHDQVTQYMKDTDKKLNMLEKYPEIQKLFREFNTPLLSSAPGRCLFRHVTKMDLPKFDPLSDCRFEQRALKAANASKC